MLDVEKLTTLRAVLEHGSFSRAGAARGLTQPAVSRQIALLERRAGLPLVRRTRQGVVPTEAGRVLAAHAAVALDRLGQAEAELADLAGLRAGEVRLGSFFTALVHLSAEAATRLDAAHPGVVVRDELVDRDAALARVAAGALDVALVFEQELEPAGPPPPDVELIELFADPPRVLLPAGHPLARRREVDAGELAGDTWVRAHDGGAARMVDAVLARAGIRPSLLLAGHGDEPVEAQALVAAGRGVTLAHALNVVVGEARLAIRSLAGGWPVRRVQAAALRGHRPPAARALLEVLQAAGAERAAALSPRRPSRRGGRA
jgi:DNA-binding transcriptional LysR family regulator